MKRFSLPDLYISIPTILLLSLGILVIYTLEPKLALQQLLVALSGLVLYWIVSYVDVESFNYFLKYLYGFIIISLIVVLLLGAETRGSLRWIPLGPFKLQPSELAKPIIILLLSKFWSKRVTSWANIFKSLLLVLPIVLLVFKQPDLGTTVVLLVIWFSIIIGANISLVKTMLLVGVTALLTPLGWFSLKDYQRVRLLSFLSPQQDPLGLGYNVIQSTIAVGSGQLLGRGLGRGTQSRLQFLPEFRTDFIFASIAEELGFVGSVIILGLYLTIILRVSTILSRADKKFQILAVLGVLSMITAQIVINISMNTGIMPITGITLPLLSYGGSSLIVTLFSLGLVASVSRFSKRARDVVQGN